MNDNQKNIAFKSLGALEYLVNTHIENKNLQKRFKLHLEDMSKALTDKKEICPLCYKEMEADEEFCINCDHIQGNINEDRKRDCEEIYGKDEE